MSRTAQVAAIFGFAWILLDSMITYFSRTLIGVFLPVSLLLPVLLGIYVFFWGTHKVLPPAKTSIILAIGLVSIVFGLIFNGNVGITQIGAYILSMCAFCIGYFALRWADDETMYTPVLLTICSAYAAVCTIAVFHMWPSLFPVINSVWSNHGVLEMRPEVTTDQNYQIFYLFPLAVMLALPFRFIRAGIIAVALICSFYVLAKLQTRSGFLVMSSAILIALLAPLRDRSLGRVKLLFIPVLMLAFVAVEFDTIMNIGSNLIARFTDKELLATSDSRLVSNTYLFEHIWNPLWWIPQGYDDFEARYGAGALPHSNMTAMFLEGGIIGLYMWVAIFVLPLFSLAHHFLKKRLDHLATLIFLAGSVSLVIQLSLNVPSFKQPWLWAGAALGTLHRVRSQIAARKSNPAPPTEMAGILAKNYAITSTRKVKH